MPILRRISVLWFLLNSEYKPRKEQLYGIDIMKQQSEIIKYTCNILWETVTITENVTLYGFTYINKLPYMDRMK